MGGCTRSGVPAKSVAAADPTDAVEPWVKALREEAVAFARTADASYWNLELPVEILPYLLLGDRMSARNAERLKGLGVTHVLNVAGKDGANADIDFKASEIEHMSIE